MNIIKQLRDALTGVTKHGESVTEELSRMQGELLVLQSQPAAMVDVEQNLDQVLAQCREQALRNNFSLWERLANPEFNPDRHSGDMVNPRDVLVIALAPQAMREAVLEHFKVYYQDKELGLPKAERTAAIERIKARIAELERSETEMIEELNARVTELQDARRARPY